MTENIELPGAKGLKDEAFGALQLFMPGEFVRTGKCLYQFARAMDDIADELSIDASDRIDRLNTARRVLLGEADDSCSPSTATLRLAYEKQNLPIDGPLALLQGFGRDVEGTGFDHIQGLLDYVRQSSAAFSLYMIDFHKEDKALREAAIQQGMALQLMKLVKDVDKDWSRYGRVFIPAMSGNPADQPDLVLNGHILMLDAAIDALDRATGLADKVHYWRLSVMVDVLQAAARRWNQDLRDGNPLEKEIDLDWSVIMATGMKAVATRMFAS